MGARNHYQASILTIHWLHSCPGTDDAICWAKGEVMEILVHWVARCFLPYIKRDRHLKIVSVNSTALCQQMFSVMLKMLKS